MMTNEESDHDYEKWYKIYKRKYLALQNSISDMKQDIVALAKLDESVVWRDRYNEALEDVMRVVGRYV